MPQQNLVPPTKSKPSTAKSTGSSRERSELVKFDNVRDKILPKFHAKVMIDSKFNKHKPRKLNSLAMMGIFPPKPRKKAYDDLDEDESKAQKPPQHKKDEKQEK